MKRPIALVAVLCGLGLNSCAAPSPFVGIFESLAPCRDKYAEIDAQVEAAGARSSIYYPVKGFPYFRMDRLHSSYRDADLSPDELGAWTRHMRDYDQQAREIEFINMGMPLRERANTLEYLQACGRGLAQIELEDPKMLAKLRKAMAAPHEYDDAARRKGLAAADAAAIREQLSAQRAALKPLDPQALATTGMRRWVVKPVADAGGLAKGLDFAPPDELGFQSLSDMAWKALAEQLAPQVWIENASERDALGMPAFSGDTLGVDSSHPAMSYWIGFTRFGDLSLGQITYVLWFPGTGPSGNGPLDSLVWRITLDRAGTPLVYESVHGSGREHRWYPAQPLTVRPDLGPDHDPPVVAASVLSEGPVALVLEGGSHAVKGVVPVASVPSGPASPFELERYEDLYVLGWSTQTDARGRSLFDAQGRIVGTRHPDPLWRKGSGLDEQGPLRQLGRQPTGYLAPAHLDDARVLENVFVPPPSVPKTLDNAHAEPVPFEPAVDRTHR
ncbi:MAG TPA: hypothetical protein VJM11_02595 [Nevskiaceae bacterium]|nr:hypothetical protein [Nevskiaceae bacterium]